MKRHLIYKNAKFNSNTSNAVIRIKEVDGDAAIIENVEYDGNRRYKSVPGSERIIDVISIQKNYHAGPDSTRQARVQKGATYQAKRTYGSLVRVIKVSGDNVTIQNGYRHNNRFAPIEGSIREIDINSLLVSYNDFS